jgi:hypothetical protein
MQPSPSKADRHLGSCSRGANPKRSTRSNSPHVFFIATSSKDNHPVMLVVFDPHHLLHLTPCLNINITDSHFSSSHLVSSPSRLLSRPIPVILTILTSCMATSAFPLPFDGLPCKHSDRIEIYRRYECIAPTPVLRLLASIPGASPCHMRFRGPCGLSGYISIMIEETSQDKQGEPLQARSRQRAPVCSRYS